VVHSFHSGFDLPSGLLTKWFAVRFFQLEALRQPGWDAFLANEAGLEQLGVDRMQQHRQQLQLGGERTDTRWEFSTPCLPQQLCLPLKLMMF